MTPEAQALADYIVRHPDRVLVKEISPTLKILKYRRKVFYDDLWDNILEECRGRVIDNEFNIVVNPFTKIYNYGVESRCPQIDHHTIVTAYRKVNGFMVSVTLHEGSLLVTCVGTADSIHTMMAREMMYQQLCEDLWVENLKFWTGHTLMFECVHPDDPHIIPEKPGMYFIGLRPNSWFAGPVDGFGADRVYAWNGIGRMFNSPPVESWIAPLADILTMNKTASHEGFVVYTADRRRAKMKSPHYLASKALARKADILTLDRQKVDEEFYPLLDHIRSSFAQFNSLSEQERLVYIRQYLNK